VSHLDPNATIDRIIAHLEAGEAGEAVVAMDDFQG